MDISRYGRKGVWLCDLILFLFTFSSSFSNRVWVGGALKVRYGVRSCFAGFLFDYL